jgi:hypothetical protein
MGLCTPHTPFFGFAKAISGMDFNMGSILTTLSGVWYPYAERDTRMFNHMNAIVNFGA